MNAMLEKFPEEFSWEPNVEGGELPLRHETLVGGMGGSFIAAHLLASCDETLSIRTHNDFGLPFVSSPDVARAIAVSYSGQTEETRDFTDEAYSRGIPLGVVASGGTLISFAKDNKVPHVLLPAGLPPRFSIGFQARAVSKLMGAKGTYAALGALAGVLKSTRETTSEIAQGLVGSVPLIYTSFRNSAVGYVWKIFFNETAKIGSFSNILPELAHNELQMFGGDTAVPYHVLLLRDAEDHPRIIERMDVLQEVLEERGVSVTTLWLTGENRYEKVFGAAYLGMSIAYALAVREGVDPLTTPLIDSFKDSLNS